MSSVSSTEGLMKVGATLLDVTSAKVNKKSTLVRDDGANHSGKEHRKKVSRGGDWSAHVIYDPTKGPEGLTMDDGDECTVSFRIGDSTLGYMSVASIIESVSVGTCERDNCVAYDVVGYCQNGWPDPSAYS